MNSAGAAGRDTRHAQLLSTVGAALFGAGVALFAASWLSDWKYALAGLGLLLHVAGMLGKRAAEGRAAPDRSIWEDTVYWGCWIILAALAAWMMAVRLGGA